MAETPEDKGVDALIAELQSTLDKLKAAQRKDVADEDAEESSEPKAKNLKQAEQRALRASRSANAQADQDADDKS